MKKHLNILKNSPLFAGMTCEEIISMTGCLSMSVSSYSKNQRVLSFGETTHELGLVLEGAVTIVKEDYWGNSNILSKILPGQVFAETYACCGAMPLRVDVVAEHGAKIAFLDVRKILTTCDLGCRFHERLIHNLLSVLAEKNLMMNEKLTHITQRTTREKLISYLTAQAEKQGNDTFSIPFNRQQLADYLSVDRSAMSAELCRMRDEGLLTFRKNIFTLKL